MTTSSSSSKLSDFLLFAITAVLFTAFHAKKVTAASSSSNGKATSSSSGGGSCDANSLKNSAFVFIKPHANTMAVRDLVKDKLESSGITILSEIDIDGVQIDKKKLIDQHYYSIASKATILSAKDIPVPVDKFQSEFGESWTAVLKDKRACNAIEATKQFKCTADELNQAWSDSSTKIVKFGGGFYCGKVSYKGQTLYVFNAFFMNMRSKFVGKDKSIHCYEVEWVPSKKLPWKKFRGNILGPTDPMKAPKGSIRRTILDTYEKLGLSSKPNQSDNGVHASASPLEGLAEKMNWLQLPVEKDPFGKTLLDNGISKQTIMEWSKDARIKVTQDGQEDSIFDALEDSDVEECLSKMIEFNRINNAAAADDDDSDGDII